MQAKSSSAFVVSLTLHAFVAGIIFLTTLYVAQKDKEAPVIFELVAGPPTAPEQLVAPALGNTLSKLKLDIPKVDLPEPQPEPPQAEPDPEPTPPEPMKKQPKVEPVKAPPVKPTKNPAPDKPKPPTISTSAIKKSAKTSYQDYLKKHPTPKPAAKPAPPRTGKAPQIDHEGIAQGVRGGSTSNPKGGGGGKALTRAEQSLYDTYYSFLKSALKEAHQPPAGVSDQLEAEVTFDITASGQIINPRITRSSGNREFDESVLAAFRRVRSIGPTPDGKPDTRRSVTFRMRDD